VPDIETPAPLISEDIVPTTGVRCREPASIVIVRFGGQFERVRSSPAWARRSKKFNGETPS
jgi:hypothetical protein